MKRYIRTNESTDKPSKVIFYNFVGKSIIPDIEFKTIYDAAQYAADHDLQIYGKWDGVSEVPKYL